ncbi:hypothetical protein PTTG_28152 [Puccinia triticina 1-1 BBBD Race 1]|uniref:Uncharacterized protein n=1 Tax=Puccinia triticina (isolate 1-1 / race 1 (BBBD)) TaxID=630390 RepID=A0A180GEC9_PUCT1|nr:hypothetical protein PTTG_28152 [Puccinia triticina 1-1 BBBD Race 1]
MAKSFRNPSLMASSLIRVALPQRLSWLLECSSLVRLPWGPLLLVPRNCTNPDPTTHRNFEQPVWQTLKIFVREACCMIAYYLIQWMSRPARGSKELGYTPIPRDSMDGRLQEEEEQESTLGDTLTPDQPVSVSDSLIQAAHLKSRVCPASAPLALHSPSPSPLTSSLEPELLVNQHKPSVLQLVGLQKLVFWLPALFDICGTTLMNAGLLFVPVSVFQMIRGALPIWVGLFLIIFLNQHLSREKWISLTISCFSFTSCFSL